MSHGSENTVSESFSQPNDLSSKCGSDFFFLRDVLVIGGASKSSSGARRAICRFPAKMVDCRVISNDRARSEPVLGWLLFTTPDKVPLA